MTACHSPPSNRRSGHVPFRPGTLALIIFERTPSKRRLYGQFGVFKLDVYRLRYRMMRRAGLVSFSAMTLTRA